MIRVYIYSSVIGYTAANQRAGRGTINIIREIKMFLLNFK